MPEQTAPEPVRAEIFAEAEAVEFGKQDRAKAADSYRRLAESGSTQVRVEALMRLGRLLRREGRWAGGTQKAYCFTRKVQCHPRGRNAGRPRRAGGALLGACGEWRRACGAAGGSRLVGGVDCRQVENHEGDAGNLPERTGKSWHPKRVALPADWDERMTLAAAAWWAFEQEPASGRAALRIDGQAVSVSWERQGSAWRARLIGPSMWRALWTNLERDTSTVLRVADAGGACPFHGTAPTRGQAAFRSAETSGTPVELNRRTCKNPVQDLLRHHSPGPRDGGC